MQLLATYTFGQVLLTVLELALLFPLDLDRDHRRHRHLPRRRPTGWAKADWRTVCTSRSPMRLRSALPM
jgi:hypothetical protein